MFTGFLDLQFAIPLCEHGFLLRRFAGDVCLSSLFGQCDAAYDGSRCARAITRQTAGRHSGGHTPP
eukprot:2139074-Alexandrium_andersonii.AAC.1